MIVQAAEATTRFGAPQTTVERGTIEERVHTYVQKWNWPCGCAGETIGRTLVDVRCCDRHK